MPASLGSYAAFVSFLLTLGPKLQTLWPKLQALIAAFNDVVEAVKGFLPKPPADDAGTLAFTAAPVDVEELTPEVQAAEAQVAALVAGENALFDVATIRLAWHVIQAIPWLYDAFKRMAAGEPAFNGG